MTNQELITSVLEYFDRNYEDFTKLFRQTGMIFYKKQAEIAKGARLDFIRTYPAEVSQCGL